MHFTKKKGGYWEVPLGPSGGLGYWGLVYESQPHDPRSRVNAFRELPGHVLQARAEEVDLAHLRPGEGKSRGVAFCAEPLNKKRVRIRNTWCHAIKSNKKRAERKLTETKNTCCYYSRFLLFRL